MSKENSCLVKKIGSCEGCNILEIIKRQPTEIAKTTTQKIYCPEGEKIYSTTTTKKIRTNIW